ncbi:hypothetical protein E2C01_035987 [Portunus trituberculatus]|uniref:Uncharacterized protein n=1 Tax=Portunus trituberculatus TaxID=210409 RepID=A0A5B7FAM2_PORTR|nr:hypothetical protein [Portunus trituberculatus]
MTSPESCAYSATVVIFIYLFLFACLVVLVLLSWVLLHLFLISSCRLHFAMHCAMNCGFYDVSNGAIRPILRPDTPLNLRRSKKSTFDPPNPLFLIFS